MENKRTLGQILIHTFTTICILSLLASVSAVPISLAIKFIMWLF